MKDYRYMKMYTVPGTDRIIILREGIPTHIFIIVSPFDPDETEEENVRAVHDLYPNAPGEQTSTNLIYGEAHGESFGVIVFRPYQLKPTLGYCQKIVEDRNQPGLITWTLEDGAQFVARDGTKINLPPWDKTVARLEEWCQHLKPDFKILGTWNREMSFMQEREALLDGKLHKRHD